MKKILTLGFIIINISLILVNFNLFSQDLIEDFPQFYEPSPVYNNLTVNFSNIDSVTVNMYFLFIGYHQNDLGNFSNWSYDDLLHIPSRVTTSDNGNHYPSEINFSDNNDDNLRCRTLAAEETGLSGYPYTELIRECIVGYYDELSKGRIKVNPIFLLNPEPTSGGMWILPEGYDAPTNHDDIVTYTNIIVGSEEFQTYASSIGYTYAESEIVQGINLRIHNSFILGNGSVFIGRKKNNKTYQIFTPTQPNQSIRDLLHETGHAFLGLPDRRMSSIGNLKAYNQDHDLQDLGKNYVFLNPYDLMTNQGVLPKKYGRYAGRPVISNDLKNLGLIQNTEVFTADLNGTNNKYEVLLRPIHEKRRPERFNENEYYIVEIPILNDINHPGDMDSYTNNQKFIIEYHDGYGMDFGLRSDFDNAEDRGNHGVMIWHMCGSNILADIEVPRYREMPDPMGYYANGEADAINWMFSNGKPTHDWLDQLYKKKGYTNNPDGGENWWNRTAIGNPAYFFVNSHPGDFYNETEYNKFTPRTVPSTESWLLQDTHIAVYIKEINDVAKVEIYRNYYSKSIKNDEIVNIDSSNGLAYIGESLNVYGVLSIKENTQVVVLKNSNLIINEGAEFIIEPGAQLLFEENAKLIIKSQGNINISGTPGNPIKLNGYNGCEWNGIDVYGSANVNIEYCKIENADIGISFYNYNDSNEVTINNCTLKNNNIGAYIYSSTPWLYKNTFENNSHTDISVIGKYACPYLKKATGDGTLTYNNIILGEAGITKNASITLEPGGTIYLADGNNKIIKGNNTNYAIRNYTAAAIGSDPLNAQNNYWGIFNISDINNLFFPNANSNPWIDCSNYMTDKMSRLKTAIALEESGEKEAANIIYSELIPEDDTIALMSIPRMKNSSSTPSEFIGYANSMEDELSGVNRNAIKKAKAEAYLEDNNYNAALSEYMELRSEAVTDEEITEADLDIALLQMNEQVTARINGNWVSAGISSERFNELRAKVSLLRDKLLNRDNNAGENYNSIKSFRISNSPNPFNPVTTIEYFIPSNGIVELSIYNLLGQKVKTLVNESMAKGEHSVVWNGKDDNNSSVASGIYFYRLMSDGKEEATGKMLLIK